MHSRDLQIMPFLIADTGLIKFRLFQQDRAQIIKFKPTGNYLFIGIFLAFQAVMPIFVQWQN